MSNVTLEPVASVPMDQVPLFVDYPPGLLQFGAAFCVLYIVVGVPGNLITIAALSRYQKVSCAAERAGGAPVKRRRWGSRVGERGRKVAKERQGMPWDAETVVV